MSELTRTTPFYLLREIAAAGQGTPSVYLLIAEAEAINAVPPEVGAEAHAQGWNLRFLRASEVGPKELYAVFSRDGGSITLLALDRWLPKLVDSLDRDVVLLTRGGVLLLLATPEIGERTLIAAPNLRNRFADVLIIEPERP
jgi:hypothetical protein